MVCKMNDLPYPGLRPFKREESNLFRGRDEFIDQLTEKLNDYYFIAVLGQSGCGKSSLVRSGLLSRLQLVRIGGRDFWRIATMRPGSQPFLNMATALLKSNPDVQEPVLREHLKSNSTENINALSASLQKDLQTSYSKLEALLPADHNLLIVVDQFEELFHYSEQGEQQRQEVKKFIQWLLAIARVKSKFYVVVTMRAEYLNACSEDDELTREINNGSFQIPYLNEKQIKEAIEFPAQIYNGKVEPNLVEHLLGDIDKLGPTCRPDHLPLLQYVLVQMWLGADSKKNLTLEHYEKIGGDLAAALTQTANQIYHKFTDKEKKVVEILFRRLSQLNQGGIYTRHPVKLREIADLAEINLPVLYQITDKFRQYQCDFLFARNRSSRGNFKADDEIDIRHESIIRQWRTLKQWADDEAEWAKFYRYWEKKAQLWKDKKNTLWRDLDLKNANEWIDRFQQLYPTPEQLKLWASRYGQQFDLAWKFREESRKAWAQEQKEAEEANLLKIKRDLELKDQQERREFAEKQEKLARSLKEFWWKAAIVSVSSTVLVAMFALWGLWERSNAISAKQQAEKTEQLRTENLFDSYRRHAVLSVKTGDYTQARQTLQQSYELDNKITESPRHARNFLASFIDMMQGKPQQEFSAKASLYAVALSPDNKIVAAVGAAGEKEGTVVLLDSDKGTLKRLTGHNAAVRAVVFHPNNKWIATAGEDKRILFWSLDGQLQKELSTDGEVWALAISPEGMLASGGSDKTITLWNADGEKQILPVKHTNTITSLSFNKDGSLLASASYDNTACLWDIAKRQLKHQLKAHTNYVQEVAFSPKGDKLATSSDDETVRLWNVDNGDNTEVFESLVVFKGHKDKVFAVVFSDDGRQLISGGADATLRIWDIDSGVTMRVLQGHSGFVTGVAVAGNRLFTSGTDRTIKQWDISLPHQHLIDLANTPTATAIAPNGDKVAIGFENGLLQLHDLPTRTLGPTQLTVHTKDIQRLAFSPDGKLLASASLDNTAKLWKVEDNQLTLIKPIEHQAGVNAVAFSTDGKTLFTASYDGKMGEFNIDTQNLKFHPLYEKDMNSISWNATGDTMLTTSDNQALLWKNNNWQQPAATYPMQQGVTWWAALSPDAQQVALVGDYFTVKIHPSGQPAYDLPGHKNSVLRAIFSPDGQQLATVSGDNTVKFWDLLQRSELFTINLPTNGKNAVWDFDFRCMSDKPTCWVAVPLSNSKQLALYELSQ